VLLERYGEVLGNKDSSMNNTSSEEVPMRERFAKFLNGFSAVLPSRTSVVPRTARLCTLLKQFGEHRDRTNALDRVQTTDNREHMRAVHGQRYDQQVHRVGWYDCPRSP